MGLLDDAIREHLELKRRSGADPGDVARLEHEAFGAAQAAAAAEAEAEPASAEAEHQHAVIDPAPAAQQHEVVDPVPDQTHEVVDPAPAVRQHEVVDPPAPRHDVIDPAPAAATDPPPAQQHVDVDPAPAKGSGRAPAADEDEQATRQFTALEADEAQRPPSPAAAKADEDEVHDELEETPDFLQETPDHDRLWFEQKPPRDFDF